MRKIKFLFVMLTMVSLVGCDMEDKKTIFSCYNKVNKDPNDREFVDLGLPSGLKWATINLGADYSQNINYSKFKMNVPQIYGGSYKWGSLIREGEYKKMDFDISGDSQYDAVRSEWGGDWRIPTVKELQELVENCKWEYVKVEQCDDENVCGYKVIGPNGNSMFLPVGGVNFSRSGKVYSVSNVNGSGFYYCSTPVKVKSSSDGTIKDCVYGFSVDEKEHRVVILDELETKSFLIRPVKN